MTIPAMIAIAIFIVAMGVLNIISTGRVD